MRVCISSKQAKGRWRDPGLFLGIGAEGIADESDIRADQPAETHRRLRFPFPSDVASIRNSVSSIEREGESCRLEVRKSHFFRRRTARRNVVVRRKKGKGEAIVIDLAWAELDGGDC